jgi:hypothetical protein
VGCERPLNKLLTQTLALSLHFCFLILFTCLHEDPALWKVREVRDSWMNCYCYLYHDISALRFYLLFYLKILRIGRYRREETSWMNCWLRPWLYHYISALWFYFLLNLKVLRSGRCRRGKAAEWTASSDPGSTTTQEGSAGLPLLPRQVMGSSQGNPYIHLYEADLRSSVFVPNRGISIATLSKGFVVNI